MDVSKLDANRRSIRMNIRNFLMVATEDQLASELTLSIAMRDTFRAEVIRELIAENTASDMERSLNA